MLLPRTVLLNLRRKFSDSSGQLTVASLCNEENQIKCLENMISASKKTTIKLHPSTKLASVLIPIVNCDKPHDEPSLLYTLRSHKMRKHVNQVSFPGGILEEHDQSHIDCALRETEEEIGIKRDQVFVWGETHLVHLRNAPAIMPVIGMVNNYNSDQLKLNEQEVDKVFTVPISVLMAQKRHTQFRLVPRNVRNISDITTISAAYSIPVFTISEKSSSEESLPRIWGITAILTHLFLQSLLPAQIYDRQIPFIKKYK
ncbi:nucleoside diphosphate-linked moiety X motif 8 [Contarinia nasturtii]|uniref:nucleoside diphosphate-linked moiety X motif 8 n=1 Tax=Contarinia nasturtii TaxID=265458 RepID=UPI0012D3E856|nr:nucleoside diphosphate-linked moiety X motif 8 [Contarinia nasturtii]